MEKSGRWKNWEPGGATKQPMARRAERLPDHRLPGKRDGPQEKTPGKPDSQTRGWRFWVTPVLCVAVGILLAVLQAYVGRGQSIVSAEGKILREGYGGSGQEYELVAEGLEQNPVELKVRVSPRKYTQEEAEEAFEGLMAAMEERIRGENPSLQEVSRNLKLPTRLEEEGIRLRWQSGDPDYLSSAGELAEGFTDPVELTLYVQLSDSEGIFRADYELPIRLVPAEEDREESRLEQFAKALLEADEQQQTSDCLALPASYEGHAIRYREKKNADYMVFPLLGVLAAVLVALRGQSQEKEAGKKREKELLFDYADLVSKLMVLIGAGMTIRVAWERMVKDYENGLAEGKQKKRAAYEEMQKTWYQLANGMPEGTAYREFGNRCRLQPYRKLSSLLEQNRRAGTKNLRGILAVEMTDAFELRKNLARRLGEEAGTRLLLPLFLMLGIVMVMIMVPAMLTMG